MLAIQLGIWVVVALGYVNRHSRNAFLPTIRLKAVTRFAASLANRALAKDAAAAPLCGMDRPTLVSNSWVTPMKTTALSRPPGLRPIIVAAAKNYDRAFRSSGTQVKFDVPGKSVVVLVEYNVIDWLKSAPTSAVARHLAFT
jgi:hypothetical protein